ncbi:hypothetical protein EDD22DRAFT_897627 [Suillus occidentalis]|nr:hypothetical protein EDD22DRAFT_897627 [Suillus occidentalis]
MRYPSVSTALQCFLHIACDGEFPRPKPFFAVLSSHRFAVLCSATCVSLSLIRPWTVRIDGISAFCVFLSACLCWALLAEHCTFPCIVLGTLIVFVMQIVSSWVFQTY